MTGRKAVFLGRLPGVRLLAAHRGARRGINGTMRTQAFNAFRSVSLSLLLCPLSLFSRNLVAGEVVSWGSNRYGQTNAPPQLQASLAEPLRSGTTFSISLPTRSGRVYALEFKNSLSDRSWTALPLVA